jgi:hypothetical protein
LSFPPRNSGDKSEEKASKKRFQFFDGTKKSAPAVGESMGPVDLSSEKIA